MSAPSARARDVFIELVGNVPASDWDCRLPILCGHDPELMDRIRALLRAHQSPSSLLRLSDDPAEQPTELMQEPAALLHTHIGQYRLLQQIGEGGFGVVYMAEQTEPVRRKVALKIVKPGMDSREVIARFEAERQALALMDHPNISRVLGGGATDAGLPYFVMELVHGVPITKFCDENRLTTDHRLDLFVDVCRAVQHAHQKGIIHRDLKPSNILVTMNDDRPMPKVIDFGVAKALSQSLTDKTLYTAYGHMVGTPLYMSPEQAQLNAYDVDTRSDVYSLGVLLYELLTGATPFDEDTLRKSGFDELRRLIREVDPPRPSQRLTTLQAAVLATVSDHRRVDQRKLTRTVSGELDWIVMKALEKNRNRRYESAGSFAADIEHYLANEPVEACPPSIVYRFEKYARRHKGLLATSVLLLATLLIAAGVSLAFAIQADKERNLAKNERAKAVSAEQVSERRLRQSRADFDRALKALDAVVTELSSAEFAQLPGAERLRDDVLTRTMAFYQEIIAEHDNDPYAREQQAIAWSRIASLYSDMRKASESLEAINRSVGIVEQLMAEFPDNPDYQKSLLQVLFSRYHNVGRTREEVLADAERALAIAEKRIPSATREHLPWLLLFYNKLATQLPLDSPRTRALLEQSLAITSERGIDPDPGTLILLAQTAERDGNLTEAERYYRRGIARFEQIGANLNKRTSYIERHLAAVELSNLGRMLERFDRLEEAEACYRQAIHAEAQVCRDYGQLPAHREALRSQAADLIQLLTSRQREQDAETVLAELLREFPGFSDLHDLNAERLVGQSNAEQTLTDAIAQFPAQPVYYLKRANLRQAAGEFGLALEDYDRAFALSPRLGIDWCSRRAAVLNSLGRREEAIAFLDDFAPDSTDEYTQRGRAYVSLGQCEKALTDFTKACEISNNSVTVCDAIVGFSRQLSREDDFQNAQLLAELVCRRFPQHRHPHVALCEARLGLYQYQEALKAIETAIGLVNSPSSDDWWLFKRRAETHFRLGHYDQALADLTSAVNLNPADGSNLTWISPQHVAACPDASFRDGLLKVADEAVEKLDTAHIRYGRGRLLLALGHYDRAAIDFEKVVELHPSWTNQIAWQVVKSPINDDVLVTKCVQWAEKATAANPTDGAIWNTLGMARYRNEEFSIAIDTLRKSMELRNGGDTWDWFFLAMSHSKLNHPDEARDYFTQAIDRMEQDKRKDEDLLSVRAEAEALIFVAAISNSRPRLSTPPAQPGVAEP